MYMGILGWAMMPWGSCDDEKAKSWFNKRIQRFSGGMDRTTIIKRLGKGDNDVAGKVEDESRPNSPTTFTWTESNQ